jgi:hypothetical protein
MNGARHEDPYDRLIGDHFADARLSNPIVLSGCQDVIEHHHPFTQRCWERSLIDLGNRQEFVVLDAIATSTVIRFDTDQLPQQRTDVYETVAPLG